MTSGDITILSMMTRKFSKKSYHKDYPIQLPMNGRKTKNMREGITENQIRNAFLLQKRVIMVQFNLW